MVDPPSSADERRPSTSASAEIRLRSALDQVREDARPYNQAVGSYNTHLDNHRDRRDLHDIPFRDPVTVHDAFEDAVDGDRTAIESLLDHLLDQTHLDSQLRRHPRPYPIHVEAAEHLEMARDQLVLTLESALSHMDESTD